MFLARADQKLDEHRYSSGGPQHLQRLLVLAPIVLLFLLMVGTASQSLPGSISAYHGGQYRDVFVAALVGTAIALLGYTGVTPLEDYVLNVAGFYAVMVALVPYDLVVQIADYEAAPHSGSTAADLVSPRLATGLVVLFVFVVAGLFLYVDLQYGKWSGGIMETCPADPTQPVLRRVFSPRNIVYASLGSLALYIVWTALAFLWFPGGVGLVHFAAALLLFVHLGLAVAGQGFQLMECDQALAAGHRRFYRLIVYLMAATAVVGFAMIRIDARTPDAPTFPRAVLWLEVTEIVLFATFWSLELRRIWKQGNDG